MPRARKSATAVLDDPPMDGLEGLASDPEPAAARPRRGRPPSKTTTGTRKISTRSASGRIVSKASLTNQVRDEIETYLTLFVGTWGLRDPECADVAARQIPEIAERVAKIVSRNDKLLAKLAESGVFGEVALLVAALLPVGRQVWAAHGPGGHGHAPEAVNADDLAARYPAYTGS
jgi:hypothetical protein